MKRRALLAALTPLVAGCFSGTDPESGQPERPTAEPTSTPTTEQPTETPEPTPTTTETTQTPTGDQTAAAEKIRIAQNNLREAVYTYTGGTTDDLLNVSAETEEFDARTVLLKLDAVQTATNDAEDLAATDEQEQLVASLMEMERFLTYAADLQARLILGHDTTSEARAALEADDRDEDTIESTLDTLSDVVDNTEQPLTEVRDNVDAASTDATSTISSDEYDRKITQFEHERSVLVDLNDALLSIYAAVEDIEEAREEADYGNEDDAEEMADMAAETLDDVVDDLDDLEDDLPSRADAFEDSVADTLDMAEEYLREAEDFEVSYN